MAKLPSEVFKTWDNIPGGGTFLLGLWLGFSTPPDLNQGFIVPYLSQDLGSEVWQSYRRRITMKQGQIACLVTLEMPAQQGDGYNAGRYGIHTDNSRVTTHLQLELGSSGSIKGGQTFGPVVEVPRVNGIGQLEWCWPHPKSGSLLEAALQLLKSGTRGIEDALSLSQLLGTEGGFSQDPGATVRGTLVLTPERGRPLEVGQPVEGQGEQGTRGDESRVHDKGVQWGRPTSYAVLPVDADAGWVKVVGGPPRWGNVFWVGLPRKTCINRYSALEVEEVTISEGSDSRGAVCSPPESRTRRFVGCRRRSSWHVGQCFRRHCLGPVVAPRSLLEVRRLKNAARRKRRKWHQQFRYGASVVPENQAVMTGVAITRDGSFGPGVPESGVAGSTRQERSCLTHLTLLYSIYWTRQEWLVSWRKGRSRETRVRQESIRTEGEDSGESTVSEEPPTVYGVYRERDTGAGVVYSSCGRPAELREVRPLVEGVRCASGEQGREVTSVASHAVLLEDRLVRLADARAASIQAPLSDLTQHQALDREGAQLSFIRLDEGKTRAAAAVAAESMAFLAALMPQFRVGDQQGCAGSHPPT